MRIAVAASALLHLGLIVVTMIAWPGFRSVPPSEIAPSIPIELVTVEEETNVAPQIKKREEPEPPEEKVEEAEPPEPEEPPPPAEKPPPPKPEPEPEPEPLPEPEPKEPEKPEEPEEKEEPKKEPPKPPVKPKPEPEKRPETQVETPEENKDDFFSSSKQLLQDTSPDKQKPRQLHPEDEGRASGEFDIAGLGRQDDMTVSMIDALKYQIQPCWNLDPGALNAGELVIDMVIYFNPDGTLRPGIENPRIKNQMRYSSDSYFRAAADAAVMAVRECEGNGYKLPPNTPEVNVTFDPSKMVGGG